MGQAIDKAELFARLGYGGAYELLELALEEAGLSRPAKQAVAARKEREVARLLETQFVAVCSRGDCQEAALRDPRVVVPAASVGHCAVCQGSSNARAVDEMVETLCAAGKTRLCVVGGSPTLRTELDALVAGRLQLRLIDGTASRSAADAKVDLAWADVVALWGGTQLAHKVSLRYKGENVVRFARRSIRDLAAEVVASVNPADGARRGFRR